MTGGAGRSYLRASFGRWVSHNRPSGRFFVAIEGGGIVEQYQWLVNTGFAAVVAWYVLTRLEPSIRQLERTV